MASEANELQEKLADMENNLGTEESKVQKLQMEKLTLEAQLNRLSEETSSQNEILTKVTTNILCVYFILLYVCFSYVV